MTEQEILLKLKNLTKEKCEKLAAFVHPTETWSYFKNIEGLQSHYIECHHPKSEKEHFYSCHINYGNIFPINSFKGRIKIFIEKAKKSCNSRGVYNVRESFKEPIYYRGNESDLIEFIKNL